MNARWLAVSACTLALGGVCAVACWRRQEMWPGPQGPSPARPAPSVELATDGVDPVSSALPSGPHPRILLNGERLAVLHALGDAGAPAWRRLATRCDELARDRIEAGYEAWDWANAALDLALCHEVTRRKDYAGAAVGYFRALLDDRRTMGDGGGGDEVVRHDNGYPIRTRGCLGAIAYDWLHDAPGMTADLRKHAVDRFDAWAKWFAESGYSHDQPISNYYVGWFGAVAFAGIAAEGDDPRALPLWRRALRMYKTELAPAFRQKLAGGDFPEGWQYGDLVGAVLAIFADSASPSASSGAARAPLEELPWLREVVPFRAHALWPDGRHTLDTGDWSDKPAVAPAHALMALSVVLPANDPAARQARVLARLAADPKEEWLWLAALAEDPSRLAEDPRRGDTGYFARGTATMTMRTDWSPDALWVALTSAPSLSDHQHLDAGHFEIVRGADALIIDGGGYGSYSSLSHNVIAVDDKRENDTYAPSQGTWSDSARLARQEQTDRYVYGLAEYASAYNPPGYPREHARRSVVRAEREMLVSRSLVGAAPESARLVVYDRMTLAKPTYRATFLLHGGAQPQLRDGAVRFVVGRSAAVATTLLPAHVPPVLVKEPTELGDGPYYTNRPPEGVSSLRVEVRSSTGSSERRFLHAFVVGPSDMRPPAVVPIDGDAAQGAVIDDEAYVFAEAGVAEKPSPLAYEAPATARRHLVASLAPGGHYDVQVAPGRDRCRVSLRPGEGRVASKAGVVTFEFAHDPAHDVAGRCTLR
jgi:hypothetical protein